MDDHGRLSPRFGVLYGLLALLFAWTCLYRVPMTAAMCDIAFRPASVVATPLLVGWPDGVVEYTARDIDRMSNPPIRRTDRLVSIDGVPFTTPADAAQRLRAAGIGGRATVALARKEETGTETSFTSEVSIRSVAQADHVLAIRVLIFVLCIVMPWLCLIVGYWVAAVRPRDPLAWLVLLMLLGFSQIAAIQQYVYLYWPAWLRIPAVLYAQLMGSTWPISFTLFGVYFAGRLRWERRFGWIKWALLVPLAVFSSGGMFVAAAEAFDARAAIPAVHAALSGGAIVLPFAVCAVTFFFLVMGWKKSEAEGFDARRRLRLLFWGATVALTPLLALVVAMAVTHGPFETLPIPAILGALIFLPIFPITLAYVILVDKAMDVRVAVRQGLRYAATRGVIRILAGVFMLGALWNAWNLLNDPDANRPRKLEAIALSMVAAILVPRFAKRGFDWTDKRFFREAYDAEHMLTNLSEEVRTIVETEPLLDTVLDRIGSTLHVDKLAVFLIQKECFVPVRSRGYDPAPATAFPVTTDALRLLTESGRPSRIRHDVPDNPLRRDTISEENRSRLSQLGAELILPLIGKKDVLGAITLGPKKSEEPYSLSDAKLLGLVATQTGLALENSRLTATIAHEIAKRERMSREIEIARDVQQKLFPQKLPQLAGIDCAGYCRPAQGVGGDYYDFLALPGGRLGIALGDVAGKGIPAALLMASLQASLRGQRLSGPADLAQLVTNLNFLIYEASPDNRYATFFYGEYDPATRCLDFVNAGHNAPMMFRGATGELVRLAATGPVVGLIDAGDFQQRRIELAPGDVLLVYSDGISEAMNTEDEEWGEQRLAAAARAAAPCDAGGLIEQLMVAADAFAQGAVQHDDMTVVVVRIVA
jgi:phosphoserine phosphatase RsbU/P